MLAYEWKMLNRPKKVIAVSTTRFNIFPYELTLEIWKKEEKKKKKPIEWYITHIVYCTYDGHNLNYSLKECDVIVYGNSNQKNSIKLPTHLMRKSIYYKSLKPLIILAQLLKLPNWSVWDGHISCFLRPFITKVFPYIFVSRSEMGDWLTWMD
jgi:hypothetical protein